MSFSGQEFTQWHQHCHLSLPAVKRPVTSLSVNLHGALEPEALLFGFWWTCICHYCNVFDVVTSVAFLRLMLKKGLIKVRFRVRKYTNQFLATKGDIFIFDVLMIEDVFTLKFLLSGSKCRKRSFFLSNAVVSQTVSSLFISVNASFINAVTSTGSVWSHIKIKWLL